MNIRWNVNVLKENLTLKSSLSNLKEHLTYQSKSSFSFLFPCFVFDISENCTSIAHKLRHMCNLHLKETEISQKRSKGIKNWKITYSVILSVLSNKTNLILGFSSRSKSYIKIYENLVQSDLKMQKMVSPRLWISNFSRGGACPRIPLDGLGLLPHYPPLFLGSDLCPCT